MSPLLDENPRSAAWSSRRKSPTPSAFLASDRGGAITGANLPVDCGWLVATPWHTYGGLRGRGEVTAMLEVEGLQKSFGGVARHQDVSLKFAPGSLDRDHRAERRRQEHILQSHLGGAAAGFGRVTRRRRGHRRAALARRSSELGVARAFQVASMFPFADRRGEPAGRGHRAPAVGPNAYAARFPLQDRRGRAFASWQTCSGLRTRLGSCRANLSHGDQKLLDIALALVLEPRVLLLDEPTAGMGPDERWQMIDKVQRTVEAPEDHARVHRARHGHRVQDRAAHLRALLRRGARRRTPGRDPRQPGVIEAYLGTQRGGTTRHEPAHRVSRRRHRSLLRPARSCSASSSRCWKARPWRCSAATAPARARR